MKVATSDAARDGADDRERGFGQQEGIDEYHSADCFVGEDEMGAFAQPIDFHLDGCVLLERA